jgi:hypothetical protein
VATAYEEMAAQLRGATLVGSGLPLHKQQQQGRPVRTIKMAPSSSSSSSPARGYSSTTTNSPPLGPHHQSLGSFDRGGGDGSHYPPGGSTGGYNYSHRSTASAVSDLSTDPLSFAGSSMNDPFNHHLDDYSEEGKEWRLGTGCSKQSSIDPTMMTSRADTDAGASTDGAGNGWAAAGAVLPVHVINLVVENRNAPAPAVDVLVSPHPPPTVAPRKPFRLQLAQGQQQNLHFGGHRTREGGGSEALRGVDDVYTASPGLAALAGELPAFYTEIQDEVVMRGDNPRHWSIPAMPSTLPDDPPLVARARQQSRKERQALLRRTEKLLARLDAEKKARRAERKSSREALRTREQARRKEEQEAGIFEDVDDDTSIIAIEDGAHEDEDEEDDDDDEDDEEDDDDDDEDRANPTSTVRGVLSLLPPADHASWVNSKSPLLGVSSDFAVYALERYRLSMAPSARIGLGLDGSPGG